jgi:hypothetical protein
MSVAATSALAVSFTHTAAVGPLADYDLLPADTLGVPTPCNVATGTYRMCLATAATDFLRASQAAINAAMLAEGSTNTVAFSLSSAGIVTITFSAALSSSVTFASGVWQRLGLASNSIALDSNFAIVGTRPVWHLAILAATTGQRWQPSQPGGAERTNSGRVYTFGSPSTSWTRSLKVHFQPSTPTVRAARGDEATALYPDTAYMDALGSTATAREWSVLDVLRVAGNASCALALGTWQAIRTSTTERYWLGYVAPESLLSQAVVPLKEEWSAYEEWALGFVLPSSSPSGTRA